jgi:hypothetical protein
MHAALTALRPTADPEYVNREPRLRHPGRDASGTRHHEVNVWPDGIAPHEFDANVTQANQDAMVAAMNAWQAVAT